MPRERYPLHVVVHVPPPRLHRLVRVVPVGETQAHRGIEHLALTATDDRGGHYTSRPYEGRGFGQGRDWQWRGAYRFAPALDPTARQLRLVLAALTWPRPDQARRRGGPPPTVVGPWAFAVTR